MKFNHATSCRHTSGSSRDTEVGVDIDGLVKVMRRVAVTVAFLPQAAGAKRTNTYIRIHVHATVFYSQAFYSRSHVICIL